MGSALPLGEPVPADGSLPSGTAHRSRDRLRRVPARAVLPRALRLLRLQHLHLVASSAAPARISTPTRSCARSTSRRRCSSVPAALRPATTVFFGGGTPTLLPPGDLARMLGGVRDTFGIVDGAEVTVEANPDTVSPSGRGRARGIRCHPALDRHAVGRPARPRGTRSHARPRERPHRGVRGARCRARRERRPDLRRPRRVARRLARLARGRDRPGARPHLGLRADHRGRHEARAPDPPRRGRRPGRRPAGRHVRARRRPARGRRIRLVRGVELGPRRGPPLAAQPRLLVGHGLVGLRARRAQPHRRECGSGTSSTPRRTRSGSRRASRPPPDARARMPRPATLESVLLRTRIREGLPVAELQGEGRHAVAALIADGLDRRARRRCGDTSC